MKTVQDCPVELLSSVSFQNTTEGQSIYYIEGGFYVEFCF